MAPEWQLVETFFEVNKVSLLSGKHVVSRQVPTLSKTSHTTTPGANASNKLMRAPALWMPMLRHHYDHADTLCARLLLEIIASDIYTFTMRPINSQCCTSSIVVAEQLVTHRVTLDHRHIAKSAATFCLCACPTLKLLMHHVYLKRSTKRSNNGGERGQPCVQSQCKKRTLPLTTHSI